MMKALGFFLGLMLLAIPIFAATVTTDNDIRVTEILRIKINNSVNGSIEVSKDKGLNWEPIGSVIYPTEKISSQGFAASKWIESGRVAATAVNAIHIKTGPKDRDKSIFSLLPVEFLQPPKKYKSFLSPNSSIYTNIIAGSQIFGGEFSPFVGNEVKIAPQGKALAPMRKGYVPKINDFIYIIVKQPVNYPKEMVFENSFGGKITLKYFNGQETIVGQVLRPVSGIGRFEGGVYTGSARIRANHPGVIDVSVSPMDQMGGFQIVPSVHAADMAYVKDGTQWMIISPIEVGQPALEGLPPFFRQFIRPVYDQVSIEAQDWDDYALSRFLVDVKYVGTEKWHPMPIFEINKYYFKRSLPTWANSVLKNVSHIRILFPITVYENLL